MKIVVMSDSHRRIGVIDKVMNAHPDANLFIHCGDFQDDIAYYSGLLVVAGNGDSDARIPKEMIQSLQGHRIYITHSHRFSYVHRHQQLVHKAKELNCDIVLYGHTHIPHYEVIDSVTLINPGSLFYNRDYSKPSYVILNLDKNNIDVEFVRLEG